ncbi:MAG: T9SS type A sorting domain-containing protein [Bacteroidota bacterium]|nr:T9SS type A sorting domain-containing protein [Bacteroidota bacterium]
MKKSFVLLFFFICSVFCVSAQLESWHWQEAEYHFDSSGPGGEAKILMNYWINGDTVFNGVGYKKLYRACVYQDSVEFHEGKLIYPYGTFFIRGIREDEQKRIYCYNESSQTELLLYDFSEWNIGDTLFLDRGGNNRTYVVISENNLDSIQLLDGNYAKVVTVNQELLIRGIGFEYGFLFPISPYPGSILRCMIVKFYNGNQLLWENPNYVALEEPGKEDLVNVYSVNGSLCFELPMSYNQLELYKSDGRLMHSFSNQGITTQTIGPLSKGIYLYKVMTGNGSTITRGKAVIP